MRRVQETDVEEMGKKAGETWEEDKGMNGTD